MEPVGVTTGLRLSLSRTLFISVLGKINKVKEINITTGVMLVQFINNLLAHYGDTAIIGNDIEKLNNHYARNLKKIWNIIIN